MSKYVDLTGFRSGRLLVIEHAGFRQRADGRNRSLWRCVCDCGNEVTLPNDTLQGKNTRSCGCLARDVSIAKILREVRCKPPGFAASNKVYHQYHSSANQRGHEFTITADDFRAMSALPCHYCGALPVNTYSTPAGTFTYNGLDRVDNTRGYVPDNLVPCCTKCNLAKHTRSASYMTEQLPAILARRRQREAS